MVRRPPRSTRTDTRFPYTTLFRSFWFTDARRKPGMLVGVFLIGYGLARFTVEFFREPDAQLVGFAARTGLHMGQWLTVPMIAAGIYLVAAAWQRSVRSEERRVGKESVSTCRFRG